jgi:hypothetical protein
MYIGKSGKTVSMRTISLRRLPHSHDLGRATSSPAIARSRIDHRGSTSTTTLPIMLFRSALIEPTGSRADARGDSSGPAGQQDRPVVGGNGTLLPVKARRVPRSRHRHGSLQPHPNPSTDRTTPPLRRSAWTRSVSVIIASRTNIRGRLRGACAILHLIESPGGARRRRPLWEDGMSEVMQPEVRIRTRSIRD